MQTILITGPSDIRKGASDPPTVSDLKQTRMAETADLVIFIGQGSLHKLKDRSGSARFTVFFTDGEEQGIHIETALQ